MKIWFQLLSAEERMQDFIRACQAQVNRAADPGTTVEVHGTKKGALGDNYRFFEHLDTREVVENIVRLRQGGYDALVIGNSMDIALVEAREMLDIPVLALTETTIAFAEMMGERYGIIVPNAKFIPRYREVVVKYRQEQRLAALVPLEFAHIPDMNRLFRESEVQDRAIEQFRTVARQAIAQGAEVLIPAGPPTTLLTMRDVHEVDGVPILDGYTLLVKFAETAVKLRILGHPVVSRYRLYASPPAALLAQARAEYQRDL